MWVGLLLLFTLSGDTTHRTTADYWLIVVRIGGFAAFFNLLYYLVLPLYFAGRKRAFYGWVVVVFLGYVAYSIGTDYWLLDLAHRGADAGAGEAPPRRERPWTFLLFVATFIGLAIFGVAATFRGFAAFESKRKAEEEANRQRLEAEIALLKSQINPHFLLNTINNLYALALTAPDKTPDALLKLSEMVSYILYECASPRVTLARDLDFIASYVDLQRLRLPPNAELRLELPAATPERLLIEPMLLVPFVENAFKHGLTTSQPCTISIRILLEGNELRLQVKNLLLPPKQRQNGQPSGIGMANTRQRLQHAYPDRHTLHVEQRDGHHHVELQLNLAP